MATKKKTTRKASHTAKKAKVRKSRKPQVCGHPGCGQTGHNARAHDPVGGRFRR